MMAAREWPEQCRAAGALLNITQERFGEISGLPQRPIAVFEAGHTPRLLER
jgi:hypothetical protein